MEDQKILIDGYKDFAKRNAIAILLILLLFVALVAFFFMKNPDAAETLAKNYGLAGILLGAIIANATIVIPIPFDVILLPIFANPLIVGLPGTLLSVVSIGIFAGIGAAIGECSSYVFGSLGIDSIKKLSKEEMKKLEDFRQNLESSGPLIVFVAAFLPFPFDFVGVAAGMMKYNFYIFFACALAGKLTRHVLLGLAVFYGIGFLSSVLA